MGWTPQSSQFATHVGLSPRKKFHALQAIKEGAPLDKDDASDSDVDLAEREFELGQWVDCKDTTNKWLCAQICKMTATKIWIHYDGWADKWNAWFDKASPLVAPLGRHTLHAHHKARGNKRKVKEGS